MNTPRQRYRRLQVDRIWGRAWLEILAIIISIIVCCSVVVSGYESSYSDYSSDFTTDNARQLAHSVSMLLQKSSIDIEAPERAEYAGGLYSELLDQCFVNDATYSGAIYRVTPDGAVSFAESSGYAGALGEGRLTTRDGALKPEIADRINDAASGKSSYGAFGADEGSYMAFEPVCDPDTNLPYAVVVTQVLHRSSVERGSVVTKRLVWISIVCGILIIIYYLISAARSQSRNKNGEVVS